jgi:RES domain-containing protein
LRFRATCYRAHDPRWSFLPLSGEGAARRGARFNPKGAPALYLALTIMTAVKEINQGFARKIEPCVLCSYDVDCAPMTSTARMSSTSAPMTIASPPMFLSTTWPAPGSSTCRRAESRPHGELRVG